MATIYANEARARLYKKVEEELQPLFAKIEAAVNDRQSSLTYDGGLDDLQQQYLKDLLYTVKAIAWVARADQEGVREVDETGYIIAW